MKTDDLNQQWFVAEHPVNELKEAHFGFREVPLDDIQDGQLLLKTHYLNVAPIMRMYMMKGGSSFAAEAPLDIGDVIHGRGIGEVVASKHADYKTGDFVHGQIGWQSHKISSVTPAEKFVKMVPRGIALHYGLSALGMTGYSAYCGFVSRGDAKAGEAVLVSGGAGGVGSLVVQMAKAMGCTPVIAIAGGKEKCDVVKSLGADGVIDYKSEDVGAQIKALLPDGIDVYFDNVGGEILEAAVAHLRHGGRAVLCGGISEYARKDPFSLKNFRALSRVSADLRGFFVYHHQAEFAEAEEKISRWILEGKLSALVDIQDGFDKMPQALMGLYSSQNIGKRMVRVSEGEEIIY